MRKILLLTLAALMMLPVSAASPAVTHPSNLKMTYDPGYLKENSKSQNRESLLVQSLLPLALTAVGSTWQDYAVKDDIGRFTQGEQSRWISDMMLYAPGALMLGTYVFLPATYGKESDSFNRLLVNAVAGLAMDVALTSALKYSFKRQRPDASEDNSFPSGHTAITFYAATMLHKEYGCSISPWISVAGYGVATGMGLSRIAADKHWMSDVLTGAGIGIFSAEFAYWLDGIIFGEDTYRPQKYWPEDRTWSFGLNSSYNFNRFADFGPGSDDGNLRPGYTIGMQGVKMLNDWAGALVSFDMTQLRWSRDDKVFQTTSESLPYLASFRAGATARHSVYGPVAAYADLALGLAIGADTRLIDSKYEISEYSFPTNFDANARAGLSIRTSNYSEINCYCGLDCYCGYGMNLSLGTSFNLVF